MQQSNSFFTGKIVNEDLETIQRALVIAHQFYSSRDNYDEALNITRLLSENLDKDGALKISCRDTDSCPYYTPVEIKREVSYEN
jgi:hypothetical protein